MQNNEQKLIHPNKGCDTMKPLFINDRGSQSSYHPSTSSANIESSDSIYLCLFCNDQFNMNIQDRFLRHLLLEHKFVIADVNLVADLPRYVQYWRNRFQGNAIKEFCPVIKTNSLENDQAPSDYYYMLCDLLPEDKTLREKLQMDRLNKILELNRCEREDKSFSRMCLFCKKHFTGNRQQIFNHMLEDHNFSVGRPDNIVYGSQLLDLLECKLKSLQCLYCEKTFKTWEVLKEHMRKKQHKKINPKNSAYDRFYVINYLEVGRTWETLESEDDCFPPETEESETEEWSDWNEEENMGAVCLFCDISSTDFDTLCLHMLDIHEFNLTEIKSQLNLNFYQQVKLINYIRRQVLLCKCYCCQQSFANSQELSHHLKRSGHIMQLPGTAEWDQPQFFFSTFENDNLLCIIDNDDTDEIVPVVPEDITLRKNTDLSNELQHINLSEDEPAS